MSNQEKYPKNGLDDRLDMIEERLERLERGVGSGATSCFADREASGKQDRAEEEERSDEPKELAVSPGEAVAKAFVEFRRRLDAKAAEYMTKHSTTSQLAVMTLRAHYLEMAAAFRGMSFATLFDEPQPDSEQSENAGDGKPSQESAEASADPNNGTASGRRNVQGMAAGADGPPMPRD